MKYSHDFIEFLKFNKIMYHDFYSVDRIDLFLGDWDLTIECHNDIFELYGYDMNTGEEIYSIFLDLKDLVFLLSNV